MNKSNNFLRSEFAVRLLTYLDRSFRGKIVLLRNANEIADGSFRDLDIFVDDRDGSSVESVLSSLSGTSIVRFVKRYHFKQFILYSDDINDTVIIDCWDELSWKGISYSFNGKRFKVLKNRDNNECIPVLEESLQLAIASAKCATQTGVVKQKYINRSGGLNDLRKMWIEYFGYDYSKIIGRSKWSRFILLTLDSRFNYFIKSIWWLISFVFSRFQKKGMLVELVGPDGSGKTTFSNTLMHVKSPIFPKIKYYHGRIQILPRLSRLFRFERVSKTNVGADPDRHIDVGLDDRNARPRKFTIIHFIYYVIDGVFAKIYMNLMIRSEAMIIIDRSPLDLYARIEYRWLPEKLKKLYVLAHPNPDYRCLLVADPVSINKRKNELSVKEITDQYAQYKLALNGYSYITLDTDDDPEVTYSQLIGSFGK